MSMHANTPSSAAPNERTCAPSPPRQSRRAAWLGVGLLTLAVGTATALALATRGNEPVSSPTTDPDAASKQQPASGAPGEGPRTQPRSMQMSLPPEFERPQADGKYATSGFRVGYFEPTGTDPFYTFTITRSDVRIVSPGVGEIALPSYGQPGGGTAVVRIQTLGATGPSAWSDASPPFPLASLRTSSPLTRTERLARPARAPRRVTAAALAPLPALQGLLASQKPADMSDEEAMSVFQNPRELATALVISRDLKVSFASLHAAIKANPRKRLVDIVKTLQPATNATRAVQEASRHARALTNLRKAPAR